MPLGSSDEAGLKVQQHPTHANANGGEKNMKSHIGRKLNARQNNGIKVFHGHLLEE